MSRLRGEITVRAEGERPERFFNLCGFHGISLKELTVLEEGFQFTMEAEQFFEAGRLAKKAGVRLLIQRKRGPFFFMRRNRRRLAFFGGMVFCVWLLWYSSLFIWDIRTEGNLKYTDGALLSFLEEKGYVHGMKKSGIVCADLEREIRTAYSDITWVSAEITGNRLLIRIKENQTGDLKADSGETGSILADREGTVVSIVTRTGTPLVHEGDQVKKGDVLISGTLEILDEGGNLIKTRKVRADGDVTVRLSRRFEESFPLENPVRIYTGNVKKRRYVEFFGKRLYLPGGKADYEAGDTVDEHSALKLWGNFYLPIGYGTVTVREYREGSRLYSEEEAGKQAERLFLGWCESLEAAGAELSGKPHLSVRIEDGICRVVGTVETIEQAGIFAADGDGGGSI